MKKTVTETSVGCVVQVEGDHDDVSQWCDSERDAAAHNDRERVTVEFIDGATRDRKHSITDGALPPSQGIATYVDIEAQSRESGKPQAPRYPDI